MVKPIIELKQEPTTIWIKKGTKQMLDALGGRKDSYDDIIRRLIQQIHNQETTTRPDNYIQISNDQSTHSSIIIENKKIEFKYNIPKKPLSESFKLSITETNIQEYTDKKEMAEDYLRIIEKIIKQHLDPVFKIDKKHILDLDWWERMFTTVGLTKYSFEQDIQMELLKMGIIG